MVIRLKESMEKLSEALEAVDQLWVDWVNGKEDFQLTEKIHYHEYGGTSYYASHRSSACIIFSITVLITTDSW